MSSEPQTPAADEPAEADVWTPGNVTFSRSVPDRHDATEPEG